MRKATVFSAALAVGLFCAIALTQEPVQNIDPKVHPHLAAAQHHVAEANREIVEAQKDNPNDLGGHAQKARLLLVQANQELKAAAESANAAMQRRH